MPPHSPLSSGGHHRCPRPAVVCNDRAVGPGVCDFDAVRRSRRWVVGTALTLHIGQPKSGTTSLQRALAAHPQALADAGVMYPLAPGRDSFGGEVSDLHVMLGTPQATHPADGRRLRARAEAGAWQRLVSEVRTAELPVLISNESLFSLHRGAVHYVVDALTGSKPESVRVVAVVRPLSTLLASLYGDQSVDTILPGFELWARAWLHTKCLRVHPSTGVGYTEEWRIVNTWHSTGAQVELLSYNPRSPSYWDELFVALGIGAARDQIQIGQANPTMTALGIAAWQRYLRRGVDALDPATKRLHRAVRARLAPAHDAHLGGRLALTNDVAALVDEAFPQPPAGVLGDRGVAPPGTSTSALQALTERLGSPRPITEHGLSGSYESCTAALVERITAMATEV